MKLLIFLVVAVLQVLASKEDQSTGFEESYSKIRKQDLRTYVKVFEGQMEDITEIDLSRCNYFKHGKGIEEKNREYIRFCIFYINLKGMAEGKPSKGLAWPVKGQDKLNLDQDGIWARLDMYGMGLLKNYTPTEEEEEEEKEEEDDDEKEEKEEEDEEEEKED